MTTLFLLAGEASGDLHGSILARALLAARPDLELWGVGGERMEDAGVHLLLRSEELSVVGFVEVLTRIRQVMAAMKSVRRFLAERRPAGFIPIDYPEFNFRLLPHAARLGIPIVYYISPQVWAWRARRVEVLKRYVRRMVVIFPFEERIYAEAGVPVTWVGHPLVDILKPAGPPPEERRQPALDPSGPAVALLPGSRSSEIRRIAPLLGDVRRLADAESARTGSPRVRWILGRASGLDHSAERHLARMGEGFAAVLPGVDALRAADCAIVASGTVTLEALLLGRPVLVVYRMHPLTYQLARRMVRVEHIAMANLVARGRVVPEFIQGDASAANVSAALQDLLSDEAAMERTRDALLSARSSLGPPGAGDRAAQAVLEALEQA